MTTSKLQPILRSGLTSENERRKHEAVRNLPIKIMQIGEGNFLRGFADWMIHEAISNGKYHGSVVLTPPTPRGAAKLKKLAEQDGLYTLVVQGLQDGKKIEKRQIISVFRDYVDPYSEWERFLQLAELESLEVVISNTTEAGLVYTPVNYVPGEPIVNFPARLAVFLHRRFERFAGDLKCGLMILPCELVENNGDVLKSYVLRYAREFGFGEAFCRWVEEGQLFLNNLVDRIVTGMPPEQEYARLTSSWGYEDSFLATTEPYYIWAIQGDPKLDRRLPFASSGLHVKWVPNLQPYRQRKVHILNGAHTLMMSVGLLYGKQTVRELMEDERLGRWVKKTIAQEVIPSLSMPAEELQRYAEDTFERFYNPYLEHRLTDIAMNSLSKFTTRLLPVLKAYTEKNQTLPEQLIRGLAGLLMLYKVIPTEQSEGTFFYSYIHGQQLEIRDNPELLHRLAAYWAEHSPEDDKLNVVSRILSDEQLWNEDLTKINGLAEMAAIKMTELEEDLL